MFLCSFLVGGVVAACSSSAPEDIVEHRADNAPSPTTEPASPTAATRLALYTQAKAFTSIVERCYPERAESDAYAEVFARVPDLLQLDLALDGVVADEAWSKGCLAAVDKLPCAAASFFVPASAIPECRIAGTLAKGAACSIDEQCADRHCEKPASDAPGAPGAAACGTCTPRANVGEDPKGTVCDFDLGTGKGGVCARLADKGAACTRWTCEGDECSAIPQCKPGLLCDDGVCQTPLAVDASCASSPDRCAPGSTCVDGICKKPPTPELGEVCGHLETVTVSKSAPEPNVLCKHSRCEATGDRDGVMRCAPLRKAGAACSTTLKCAAGHDCKAGHCELESIAPAVCH